jgi:phage terminase small subunit
MDRNATRSAVAAGFSRRTAGSQGARLLKNVNVRAAVAAEEAEVATRIKLPHDDILRDLIALRSAAAEAGQFAAAIRATEMLGRHIGMWPTRVESAHPDGTPGQQPARDAVHTVVADVISILTNHRLNLPPCRRYAPTTIPGHGRLPPLPIQWVREARQGPPGHGRVARMGLSRGCLSARQARGLPGLWAGGRAPAAVCGPDEPGGPGPAGGQDLVPLAENSGG